MLPDQKLLQRPEQVFIHLRTEKAEMAREGSGEQSKETIPDEDWLLFPRRGACALPCALSQMALTP